MAKNSAQKLEWILLIHQLPPKPTNLRVRIWRKLQKLGAVAIKNSVYVLPANEKTHEDFQWLKQEIESAGGEATVFQAASVEGATDEEIMAAFRKARDEEFAAIAAELDGLSGAVSQQTRGKHLSIGRLATHESELDKLPDYIRTIYNKAWANRAETPELSHQQATFFVKQMKPIMDERLLYFGFYKGEPISFYISLPEMNQVFKYVNGKLDWIGKLKRSYNGYDKEEGYEEEDEA